VVALADDEVVVIEPGHGETEAVDSRFGFPMASVRRWDGRSLGAGPVAAVRAWWRVALALELCGLARAALDATVVHVRDRHQFGRPLGSFQGVQHRLAECEVLTQGARWLALEAAWSRADPERAAAAMTQALRAADRVFWDTHQLSGALGFTAEYDLHLWTMRMPALRAEARALGQPGVALATARWGGAP
jgi:alkylation response protein AidB-like acyl-CoA dehydrogenase